MAESFSGNFGSYDKARLKEGNLEGCHSFFGIGIGDIEKSVGECVPLLASSALLPLFACFAFAALDPGCGGALVQLGVLSMCFHTARHIKGSCVAEKRCAACARLM